MSGLDEIFYKRLEGIREELNSYIDLRLSENETGDLAPIGTKAPKKRENKGKVQDKFLMYMKLNDEAEDGYFDDADKYLKGSARGAKSRNRPSSRNRERTLFRLWTRLRRGRPAISEFRIFLGKTKSFRILIRY